MSDTNHETPSVQFPRIGDVVGECRIVQSVGVGANGAVFKAQHTKFEVLRAIKVIRPDFTNSELNRFENEARVVANLDHPNIVRLYNSGLWKDFLPYFEMEFVDGTSLEKLISEKKPLPPVVAIAITAVVASALAHAQKRQFSVNGQTISGLIHRDIKPSNILISSEGVVKLADFGLARVGGAGVATKEGCVPGTSPYISPELLNGAKADLRADIYALGIVLYEALCGIRPFPETSLETLFASKIKGSFKSVEKIVSGLPEGVAHIINKCLNPNPDKRYQNCESLQVTLEAALSEITPRSAVDVVSTFIKNPRAVLTVKDGKGKKPAGKKVLIAGLFLAIIAGATGVFMFFHKNVISDQPLKPQTVIIQKAVSPAMAVTAPAAESAATQLPAALGANSALTAPDTFSIQKKPHAMPPAKAVAALSAAPITLAELYQRNDFAEIIRRYQSENLNAFKGRDSVVCILIEAFFRNNQTAEALRIAKLYPVRDGHYYLFMGLICQSLDKTRQAEDAFANAIKYPSIFGPDIAVNALYRKAALLTQEYRNNPGDSLKQALLQCWQEFADIGCKKGGKECGEAQQNILLFKK